MALFLGRANNSINWNVKTETSEGLVGVLSGKSYSVTYMPTDVGWVDLIATKTVDIGGASEFVTKRFNLVKNKKGLVGLVGVNGSGAIEYWLTNSVNAIVKDSSGSFNPKTITFNSKSMRGIENPIGYSGRFVIEESVNGTTFATVYTSANDESVKTHTPSANIKLLRVSLYLEGGIVTKLDEQTIPVISDGSIGRVGDNAVSVFVSTPEGSILKNANGTMIAKAELFDGTTSITGSSYRWYRGNSSATSDAGSGWESLTSNTYGITGHTTATLTIPASAIVNIESYKCVVEYNSKKYSDICVVQDITDPYNITIIGANTFKNGQGASTFVARLFQDGTEIDVGNSGKYTYKWYMYDKNDAKVNSWNTVGYKIGKSITVNATESQNQGRLTCEVDVS